MLKFVVKSVTKEDDNLIIVVVEPAKQSLLLEDEIPPGCIQHIISSLMENRDSKEDSIRLCDILSNIYMDDDSSRKPMLSMPSFISFLSNPIPADNRKMFRRYNGVNILCKLFEKHRDLSIVHALGHVMDSHYGTKNCNKSSLYLLVLTY